jgi:DNA-binding transcriptional regulator YiaG
MTETNVIHTTQSTDNTNNILELRKKSGMSAETISSFVGITTEEYFLFEARKKDLPASALFLISTILTGNPFKLFE